MKEKFIKLFEQFFSFGVIGLINTVLNLLIYWGCVAIGLHYLLANAIGFLITVAISYVLNNAFTFRNGGKKPEWSLRTLGKAYASYFMTCIVINSILLWFWTDLIGVNVNLGPLLNIFITVPLNFLMNKFWVYGKKKEEA